MPNAGRSKRCTQFFKVNRVLYTPLPPGIQPRALVGYRPDCSSSPLSTAAVTPRAITERHQSSHYRSLTLPFNTDQITMSGRLLWSRLYEGLDWTKINNLVFVESTLYYSEKMLNSGNVQKANMVHE